MNQILSLEMPKKRARINTTNQHEKANIKSVIIVFSTVLIIFGIALIGMALYSIFSNKDTSSTGNIQEDLPRINVTQSATELEIEVTSESEIENVQYFWEEKEPQEINESGKKTINFKTDIPSGNNILTIKTTDVSGRTNVFSKEYTGAKEPNITNFEPKFDLNFGERNHNKIVITCEETQNIKFISYNYDDKEDITKKINDTKGTIEIEAPEGKHKLTVKVGYEDGTVGKTSKNVFFPSIDIKTNGTNTNYTKFIIEASDIKTIEKVVINFNGIESVEQVNQDVYTKELDLKPGAPGSNKLIIRVYNKDGMSITKQVWDINRQN